MSEFYGDFDEQFSVEKNSVSTQITQRTYSLKLCSNNGSDGEMAYTGVNNISNGMTKSNSKNRIIKNK